MKKIFWIMVFEAFFGGFYVTITRGLTPIFLVSNGYDVHDLLLLNGFAGLASLLISYVLRVFTEYSGDIRKYLLIAHVSERILWFSIPFVAWNRDYVTIIYSAAVLATVPTGFLLNTSFLTLFDKREYGRLLSYRGVLGSVASVLAQLIMVFTLAFMTESYKYIMLFMIALGVGLVSSILLLFTGPITIEKLELPRGEEEIMIKATNIYVMLLMLFTSANLLGIAWTPRLMRDLNAPDYFVALIGFSQIVTSIFANIFWRNRSIAMYRLAIVGLGITPLLVYLVTNPYPHIGLAVLYSFTSIGTNFYASLAYAGIIKKFGAPRASLLLTSANAFALMIAGFTGYWISYNVFYVFMLASIFGFAGLAIGLTALPELAVIPRDHVKLYSRILYTTSLSGYNFVLFTMGETINITIKLIGLGVSFIFLFIIYRVIYYIIVLTGG